MLGPQTSARVIISRPDAPETRHVEQDEEILVESEPDAVGQEPNVSPYHIFAQCGGLKVIAVPFVPGSHIPENLNQTIAVARHLKLFHSKNLVHGDLRLLNMVFSDDKSELIDFDFGGKSGTAKYPPGYKTTLTDGRRVYGTAGQNVTQSDDVRGLVQALDLVLLGRGVNWPALRKQTNPTIDDVIDTLEESAKNGERIQLDSPELQTYLQHHTKLGARSKTKTGDGDPKSPAKP